MICNLHPRSHKTPEYPGGQRHLLKTRGPRLNVEHVPPFLQGQASVYIHEIILYSSIHRQ